MENDGKERAGNIYLILFLKENTQMENGMEMEKNISNPLIMKN